MPIWTLRGGRFGSRVPAYANGWQHTERNPAAAADAARGVVQRGYRAPWTPNMRILEPFDDFADAWAAELVDEVPGRLGGRWVLRGPDRFRAWAPARS